MRQPVNLQRGRFRVDARFDVLVDELTQARLRRGTWLGCRRLDHARLDESHGCQLGVHLVPESPEPPRDFIIQAAGELACHQGFDFDLKAFGLAR
jgi:hypothetical protein